MIVADTNVLSELMRPSPTPQVREWVVGQRASDLFVTAISIAEILYGIERLTAGKRKDRFADLARELFTEFGDQVLAFDQRAARTYANIVSRRDTLGAPINGFDAQIAAICATHGAALATRNTKDFEYLDIPLIDPWK
jgi:predicted nucleic acid-binding protein